MVGWGGLESGIQNNQELKINIESREAGGGTKSCGPEWGPINNKSLKCTSQKGSKTASG